MELNEALDTLQKAGLIAEAKASYKQFLPKDTDTIADIGTKVLKLRKYYMSCNDNAEKMQLAEIWKSLQKALLKFNKKGIASDEEDENSEDDNLPSNEDRADDDGDYMGSYYQHYGLDDPCSDEDWAEAGRQWAEDMLNNGEYTEEEYEDAIEHYKYYSYES
jgi:hypothetical protein